MRWFSMGTQTYRDPKVVRLGELHGGAGLAFWALLLMEAGAQERGGKVEATFRSFAFDLHTDAKEVEQILSTADDVHLCHTLSRDVHGFRVEIPAWKRWQDAGRKARERERRKPTSQANVTDSHMESRDVPTDSTDRQDKQISSPSSPSVAREVGEGYQLPDQVWSILQGGVEGLSESWPLPKRESIAKLVAGCDTDLCIRTAEEVREIVQSQDRAPNIAGLYSQKLREATAARSTVREALS